MKHVDHQRKQRTKAPRLRISDILAWADAYHDRHGEWPQRDCGEISECPGTTWRQVDRALRDGFRGLRGGSSLPRFLEKHRDVRNAGALSRLSARRILAWADQHRKRTGQWPKERGGAIVDAPGETWRNVSAALREGGRGLPGGDSLPRLLERHRRLRNRGHLPRLTVKQILLWADTYHRRTGRWPTYQSGAIKGTRGETWHAIHNALVRGARGLRGRVTLADLLAKHRGYRNLRRLPQLSVEQVLAWARQYLARHGSWPTSKSGSIVGTSETWARIDDALHRGFRGLPKGLSLYRLKARSRQNACRADQRRIAT